MTNMVYMPLDWTTFARWAGQRQLVRKRRLVRRGAFDEGFALHILPSGIFGKGVLQPFRLIRPGRAPLATLYAYAAYDAEDLRRSAREMYTPDCMGVLQIDDLATKTMPSRFARGRRPGFDIRVRPVRRLARNLRDAQSGRVIRKGSEVDAHRLELLRRFPDVWREGSEGRGGRDGRQGRDGRDRRVEDDHAISRQSTYAGWLAERLAGACEVDVDRCRPVDFRRSRA